MPISLTKNRAARKAKSVVKKVLDKVQKDKMPPLRSPGPACASQATSHQPEIAAQPADAVTGTLQEQREQVQSIANALPDLPDVDQATPADLRPSTASAQPATATTSNPPKRRFSFLAFAIACYENHRAHVKRHEFEEDLEGHSAARQKSKSLQAETDQLLVRIKELEAEQITSKEEQSEEKAKLERKLAVEAMLSLCLTKEQHKQKKEYEMLERRYNEESRTSELLEKEVKSLDSELRKAYEDLERPIKIEDLLRQYEALPMHKLTLEMNQALETERKRRLRNKLSAAARSESSSGPGSSSGSGGEGSY